MKLESVEMCGFRGIRERVRIEFGSGFTVISGRNGVGKSTICDAIEFALTGSINKYRVERVGSETLNDYVWWRGRGRAREHSVDLALVADGGERMLVTRRRETGCNYSKEELEEALCSGSRPDDALRLLCSTSIIRDEWISALSVDMTETERFKLVHSALGTADGSDLTDRAKAVVSSAESMAQKRREAYMMSRQRLEDAVSEVSTVEATIGRAGDVGAAREVVTAVLQQESDDTLEQLRMAQESLVQRRERAGSFAAAVEQALELVERRAEVDSEEFQRAFEDAERVAAATADQLRSAEARLEDSQHRMAAAADAQEIAASLLELAEHGETLGLHESTCPLCASMVTLSQFESGVSVARKRAEELSAGVAAAKDDVREAAAEMELATASHLEAQGVLTKHKSRMEHLAEQEHVHGELLESLGFQRGVHDVDAVRARSEEERDLLIELERAVSTLEASQFVGRMSQIRGRVSDLREEADEAAGQLRRWEAALEDAKSMERVIRRVSAEVIEEQLAQISPLLNELYQRLRPHADWRTIHYKIRGDVRRFLSLEVGEGLNPQFVLSSGQRRAVGLAFLLSIHIARRWSLWQTLLLDDPVQHIDDFRSLHFVEILSAMRLDGRQIVCTVEDEALADLICRRLSNRPDEEGRRYEVGVDARGGTLIARDERLAPLTMRAFRHSA